MYCRDESLPENGKPRCGGRGTSQPSSGKFSPQETTGPPINPPGQVLVGPRGHPPISPQGKFSWDDGSSYKGEFKYNEIHGFGVYIWSDGRRYEGQWQKSRMHGNGTFSWSDGRVYKGDYLNDQKHG